ncbi:antitoxin Xre-like helix-turn-helix domain-containing protein [Vulgatibacter sp.]|uniref:type II RES/Xre toxin-antitoxin system antitoxin n=1 Tax=Vulgatibacter sp. TaxID=1971226 RepID=UPI003563DFD1
MRSSEMVASLLGGKRTLGTSPRTDRDFVRLVRSGLPWASLGATARRLGVTEEEALSWTGLPRRTAARRKAEGRLEAEESERLLRLARVVAVAIDVLGDEVRALRWMRSANRGLGGETPLEWLDTDLGTAAVIDELLRLEYGVFS